MCKWIDNKLNFSRNWIWAWIIIFFTDLRQHCKINRLVYLQRSCVSGKLFESQLYFVLSNFMRDAVSKSYSPFFHFLFKLNNLKKSFLPSIVECTKYHLWPNIEFQDYILYISWLFFSETPGGFFLTQSKFKWIMLIWTPWVQVFISHINKRPFYSVI